MRFCKSKKKNCRIILSWIKKTFTITKKKEKKTSNDHKNVIG